MKTPSPLRWPIEATTLLLLATTPLTTAITATATATAPAAAAPSPLACDNLLVDGHKYNLQALAGPHVVVTHEYTPPTYHNTTYAIDVCGALKRKGEVGEGEGCPDGTRVCAIKHRWDPKEGKISGIDQVIPIVLGQGDDKEISWEAKRIIKDDDKSEKNAKSDGLQLTLTGGTTYQQRAQRTVVEFRCNPDMEGTENEWESVDEYEPKKDDKKEKREGKDDESTPEKQLKKEGAALVWDGYKRERDADGADMDTLYLTWHTKHACDAAVDEPVPETKHWGFFTWWIIIVFLAIATYLILGSWLNYNLHGARGWDLLPHSDMIRDSPYLMRDLIRRILNTLQSTGSRGGYSAV